MQIKTFISLLLLLAGPKVFAQAGSASVIESGSLTPVLLTLIFIILVMVLMVCLYLYYTLMMLVKQQQAEEAVQEQAEPVGLWKQWERKLTNAVPVEKEKDVMLDHEYDGIRELDNHLPPWWTGLFYFTIAFGVVYLLAYHVFEFEWAPLQEEEYRREVVKAEEQKALLANMVDESTVTILTEQVALDNGKAIFEKNCIACHAKDGGGNVVGPNLTDNYWIHGGDITSVFATIKYGVQGKGMEAWGKKLPPKDMQDIASYILYSLVGSTPLNPKEPQGDLYIPEGQDESEEPVDEYLDPTDSTTVDEPKMAAL